MCVSFVAQISNIVKGSVFEDRAVAFKEEDTPVEFSRATSLSSLTIDDEPKISNDAMLKVCLSVCLLSLCPFVCIYTCPYCCSFIHHLECSFRNS